MLSLLANRLWINILTSDYFLMLNRNISELIEMGGTNFYGGNRFVPLDGRTDGTLETYLKERGVEVPGSWALDDRRDGVRIVYVVIGGTPIQRGELSPSQLGEIYPYGLEVLVKMAVDYNRIQ